MATKRRDRDRTGDLRVAQGKTERVEVVCTPAQKASFVAAADEEGLALGAWARRTLIRAVKDKDDLTGKLEGGGDGGGDV